MNIKFALFLSALALLMPSIHAAEQYNYYTASGTNYGTVPYVTNSAVITVRGAAPANPIPGQTIGPMPLVTFLSVTSDTNTGNVIWYNNIGRANCYMTNITTTIPVDVTNGFTGVAGEVLLIAHLSTDTYERVVLSSISGGTNSNAVIAGQANVSTGGTVTNNLVLAVKPFYPVISGDQIYAESVAGSIPISSAATASTPVTVTFGGTGGAIISGHHGQPLLLEVNGSGHGASINAAAATFVP